MFEYSPYEIKLEEKYTNTTAKNLEKLNQVNSSFSDTSFTVALISDLHYFYDDLIASVSFINSRSEIDFVVVTGDLTDQGLQHEYKLMHDIMDGLSVPYFTVIGNHDYLSDGESIYDLMFGKRDYCFDFAGTHFILFDDIFWESNQTPDFTWLGEQCRDKSIYNHTIVLSHIPPHTDQFTESAKESYLSILRNAHADLNVCGHQHGFDQGSYEEGTIPYLTVPRIDARQVIELTITSSNIRTEVLSF